MKAMLLIAGLGLVAAPLCAAERKPYTRNVAIVVYENAEPLDWAGPYEVYNDAAYFGSANGQRAFNVYIVSKTTETVNAQGMKVVPSYSITDAPKPDIVLFPGGPASRIYDDPEFFAWARKVSLEAEVAQSVCTGAFVLGKAGMLDGKEVTTHYGSIDGLQKRYPKAQVKRGRRFVDNGQVVTTAGISAGIDGSLHVVARLLGRRVADDVARYMEYHWSPEASLAGEYSYLNPSTDERGRKAQTGDIQLADKDYAGAEATFRALLKEDPKNQDLWSSLGQALSAQKEHAEAGQAYARSVEGTTNGHTPYGYYAAAAQYALAHRDDEAVAMLKKAFETGFTNRDGLAQDPDFASLRSDPRMKELLSAR